MSPASISPSPSGVAVIDPHVVLRFGIRQLLSQNNLRVCWEANDSLSARDLMNGQCPDLVVYEPVFEMAHSMEFVQFLRTREPGLKVIVLTMAVNNSEVGRFLNLGVMALVSKRGELNELLQALHSANSGQVYVSPQILNDMREGSRGPTINVELLSPREREVFRLIGLGLKVSEIANTLGISPRTVDAHKQHISDKLNLSGSSSLTAAAGKWLHRNYIQPGGNGI